MNTCSKCNEEKPSSEFHRDGKYLRSDCKDCHRVTARASYHKHRESRLANMKSFRDNNPDYFSSWEDQNRDKRTAQKRDRRASDPDYNLRHALRRRLHAAIANNQKAGSAVDDLGCSIPELRLWIYSQFEGGWGWDNYGKEWELDHVKPLADFDLTDRDQFLEACNWINLRPLGIKENRGRYNANPSS